MKRGTNSNRKIENKRRSKVDLDAYRRKDAARKKKTVNPTTPEPTEICKDVTPLSYNRSKQSYGKALKKSLNSLPSSSRKRASVIPGLAKRARVDVSVPNGKKDKMESIKRS